MNSLLQACLLLFFLLHLPNLAHAEIRTVSADVSARPGEYLFANAAPADRAGAVPSGANPTITLRPNDRIRFRLSVPGHPMHIQSEVGTGSPSPVRGISNNGAISGVLEGSLPDVGVYYYHCTEHSNMYGVINVTLGEPGTVDTKSVPGDTSTPAPGKGVSPTAVGNWTVVDTASAAPRGGGGAAWTSAWGAAVAVLAAHFWLCAA